MLYNHVSIASVAHVDAPIRLSSADIMLRLQPTLERFGIRDNLLEDVAGIFERRIWEDGVMPSDAATMAAQKALAASGVAHEHIGILINTSVCRDYLEPSTASIIHGNLGLSDTCQNFDVGNACLAFLNGMDIAARMIERGDIEYALVVDGEVSNTITERTIERMLSPDVTPEQFRNEFASLTLGSGSAAMVLGRSELLPNGHRFKGSVTRAATEFSHLCRGNMDRMVTDTRTLLVEGLKLAAKTFQAARAALGWVSGEMDEFVVHQISKVHTAAFVDLLGIDPKKVLTVFPELGNIGPASVPIALSKLAELGRLKKGSRIALMGIGSGLNCSMAEVEW
ncbi:MAG: 3-oxoacyl-ACP synthase III [Xanthomonadaceae bacterium]|jgi:3-oxoacyl-[acyl-carrier-protein] synthase-3|nr:3-oxoacyl-ACP synthase III [Xanthomonadaceae bacterium]MDP2184869.1 3-oxoacyl-ACP synthase III [Xanthomonadales bacterium]MDZ4116081.1 3-oxoacyl-ACP synthase III [Xanthomonadaceae bacterium]MDZ4377141.1 3-oxoacyl-ACP synthase III [Xanthomonadaceae bacterium]PKM16033.1 MAG: 3-oxoacyl-ACP synthase III [Gammaproteobacteria bacterium HGW-Gammaproteobacteria-2]